MTARARGKHGLFARTLAGNFRVGGWSSWKNAQRRFDTATASGTRTEVEVYAFVDGRWQSFAGHLAVRSADDPAFSDAAVANRRDVAMSATVRAYDYRKVR